MNLESIVLALGAVALAAPVPTPSRPPAEGAGKVLFVCEHGSVKSLLAKLLFERAAAEAGLDLAAESRGTDADAEVPAWMKEAVARDRFALGDWRPATLARDDVAAAAHVVTFDVALPFEAPPGRAVERWDGVPPVSKDYEAGREAIRAKVDALVARLKAERARAKGR